VSTNEGGQKLTKEWLSRKKRVVTQGESEIREEKAQESTNKIEAKRIWREERKGPRIKE